MGHILRVAAMTAQFGCGSLKDHPLDRYDSAAKGFTHLLALAGSLVLCACRVLQGKEVKLLRGHAGPIDAIAWNPVEPTILASAGSDRTLRLWDTRGGGRVDQVLVIPSGVFNIGWRPDGAFIALGTTDDQLIIVDARGGRLSIVSKFPFPRPSYQLNEFAWCTTTSIYAALAFRSGFADEGYVALLSVSEDGSTVSQLQSVFAHTAEANALKFEPSRRCFATGGSDSVVCLWEAAEFACVRTFDRLETMVRGLSFSHDGAYIATASDDKIIDVVRVHARRLWVDGCVNKLSVGCAVQIRVSDGTRVRALPQKDAINVVSWAPHAHMLAYVCDDEAVPPAERNAVRVLIPPAA